MDIDMNVAAEKVLSRHNGFMKMSFSAATTNIINKQDR